MRLSWVYYLGFRRLRLLAFPARILCGLVLNLTGSLLGFGHDLLAGLGDPSRRLRLEPAHVRAAYRERFAGWRAELRRACRRQRVDLVELTTDQPFDQALLAYLNKRRRLR